MNHFFNVEFIDFRIRFKDFTSQIRQDVKGNTLVKRIYEGDPDSRLVDVLEEIYGIEQLDIELFQKTFMEGNFEKLELKGVDQDYCYFLMDVKINSPIAFIVDPTDFNLLMMIREKFGFNVRWMLLTRKELSDVKDYVKKNLGMKKVASFHESKAGSMDVERLKDSSDPVVMMVDRIITEALRRKSSDIHMEAYENELVVKYRIDGVLYEYERLDKSKQDFIISRLKIISGLDITENRIPQDGRFKIKFENETINFRISILPTIFGENAVIRILSSYQFDLSLDDIGLNAEDLSTFKYALKKIGMILVSGATGSGKTTTLYAALKTVTSRGLKIITIEDPVEFDIEGVVQIAVNNKVGLSFAEGLRSIVRQDPNVIMVGEIRDTETAKIAVNSALTGHLVLSTVHANNALDTFARLNNLGCENFLLASAIELIISQRLVRKLCPVCKKEFIIDEKYIERYVRQFGTAPSKKTSFSSLGCSQCYFTGFMGRQGVFEMLHLDEKTSISLNEASNLREMKEIFSGMKFKDIKANGMLLIDQGITTLQEFERSI